jgi:hypothetical protein
VEHAEDFAGRYLDLLDAIARKRMRDMGLLEVRLGMLDPDHDFRLAACDVAQLST